MSSVAPSTSWRRPFDVVVEVLVLEVLLYSIHAQVRRWLCFRALTLEGQEPTFLARVLLPCHAAQNAEKIQY